MQLRRPAGLPSAAGIIKLHSGDSVVTVYRRTIKVPDSVL
jgi:hypothetical protein